MYVIFKLWIVVLILYLKLNGLNAIPLIDRHKSSPLSTLTMFNIKPNVEISSKINRNLNNNSNKSIITTTETTKAIKKTTKTSNHTILTKNVLKTDPIDGLKKLSKNIKSNNDNHHHQQEQEQLISVDYIHNNNKKNDYYNYNVVDNNNNENDNDKQEREHEKLINDSTYSTIPSFMNDLMTLKSKLIPERRYKNSAQYYNDDDNDNDSHDNEVNASNILYKTFNNSFGNRFLIKHDSDDGYICLLDTIKKHLMWWSNQNGSLRADAIFNITRRYSYLDFSNRNISQDDHLFRKTRSHTYFKDEIIIAFSAAQNNLTHVPYRTLLLLNNTLNYLSLKGNQFAAYTAEMEKYNESIAWAKFPLMPALTELDISNCQIEFITRVVFKNLTNLRRLYIAHNKMLTIPYDTFLYTPSLQYLDLSYTNVLDADYKISVPTIDVIYNIIYGVKIHQMTFRFLPELVYLDLSHTKLTRTSAVAFTHLSDKLRYMSLCYTAFPLVGNAFFKNTALVGLDLSGNTYAAYNIIENAFEGVADTLKYLYFERSNIKDLAWLSYLTNLRVLGLSGNNINTLSLDVFNSLKSLQLLDLSSNHIGNWYNRVFTNNDKLRVLSLRDNNINIITSEMLRDFELLEYLSLGDNDFICDCMLRDLIDIASANNKDAECSYNVLNDIQDILSYSAHRMEDFISANITAKAKHIYSTVKDAISMNNEVNIEYNLSKLLMQRYTLSIKQSFENINRIHLRPKMRFVSQFYKALKILSTLKQCPEAKHVFIRDNEKLNSTTLKFQLLDYDDEHYWCFNETERLHFMQLNCRSGNFGDNLTRQLHNLTICVVWSVCSVIGISLIGVVLYVKRWHIHYYFSYLKSAALVSIVAKDASDQLNSLAETDPNLVYDIFISYCQNDRQWVIEELLPNVEESGDISICMHERDFQIGLTILDNIVSCMDRSRALMLIISNSFLLSHWCQFEMHLAQHRIFEVSKDHLILVFLEDIPRNKRPKTLQYLMEVKTYIKWPNKGQKTPSANEQKIFWKRLKHSLENIGLKPSAHTKESNA